MFVYFFVGLLNCCINELACNVIFDSTSAEIGTIAPGEIVSASFIVRNRGSKDASIMAEILDCACGKKQAFSSKIVPSDCTAVVCVNVRGPLVEGAYRRSVKVNCDGKYIDNLLITGDIRYFLRAIPTTLQIRNAIPCVVQEVSFEIEVADNEDVEIRHAGIDGGDIQLKDLKAERVGSEMICVLKIVPRVTKPRFVSTLVIDSSHRRQKKLRLPIMIYPKIPVDIQPSPAFLGIVKPGEKVGKTFTLKWNDSKPMQVKSVEYGDRRAIYSVDKKDEITFLDVELYCSGSPGFATGELVVELDDPSAPPVSIPYSYVVRE